MSNTYFQFKKFRIEQDACAMKVCTDACIQGALSAEEVAVRKPKKVLDIGTGTGLLSLMLAQNNDFKKQDAIEMNKMAYRQAMQNFKNTSFGKDIIGIHKDIRSYRPENRYDFIISNPPFYENSLKSDAVSKNQAMHADTLNYSELLTSIDYLLQPEGFCSVMIPFSMEEKFISTAFKIGFSPYLSFRIKHNRDKSPFRTVLFFQRNVKESIEKELIIKDKTDNYTPKLRKLLSPYYLYL